MKLIAARAKILILVVVYFLVCSSVFLYQYAKSAGQWVVHPANQNIYYDGELIKGSEIYSADGTLLFKSDSGGSSYAEDWTLRLATLHTVGDLSGNIDTGVLDLYKTSLIGYDLLNGVFNPSEKGGAARVTLDANTCITAYNALGEYNGTVGIYNYKTGEILCMVSKPTFDPHDMPDLGSPEYEGVYINRLTGGVYTPGSVFKLITTAAALENIPDIWSRQFTCEGGIQIGDEWLDCSGYHGDIDFETALAVSCNAAYATLANELGAQTLEEYASAAGVGKQFKINRAYTSTGRFDASAAKKPELGWAGIGQYTTLVNPMQYMIYMGAIANGGKATTPYYVSSVKNSFGIPRYFHIPSKQARMLEPQTANDLKTLMRNNAVYGYDDYSFEGLELCGKTGTAQIEGDDAHAWFTGFLDNPDYPLAFVVVVEHGDHGYSAAIPVARQAIYAALETF